MGDRIKLPFKTPSLQSWGESKAEDGYFEELQIYLYFLKNTVCRGQWHKIYLLC